MSVAGSVDAQRPSRFAWYWAPRLFVLNMFAYPVIGIIATLLNFDSRVAAVPMRIAVLLVSLYVIAGTFRNSRWLGKNPWLVAFALLYLLRLLYDLFVAGVPKADDALLFYVMVCLVPSIASGMAGIFALGEKRTAWYIVLVGGGICTMVVLMSLFGYGGARTRDIATTGGRLYFEALNPITIGHIGTTTLIALLSLTRSRMPKVNFIVLIGIAAMAVWTVMLAGSRGPALALAAAALVYAVATARVGWVFLILVAGGVSLFLGDGSLLERFGTSATDDSALERLAIQANAIIQFLNNPIYGSAYVELVSLEYPHNLFIDTAMSLGVVGLVPLFVVLFRSARLAWRTLRDGRSLVALLFVQQFVAFQFSSSLWGMNPFWLTAMVLGSYPLLSRRRRKSARAAVPASQDEAAKPA